MKSISCFLSISLLAGMASVAQAEGLYVGVRGGYGMPTDKKNSINTIGKVKENDVPGGHDIKGDYNATINGGAAFLVSSGYELDLDKYGSICPEFEFGYRYNPYSETRKLELSITSTYTKIVDVVRPSSKAAKPSSPPKEKSSSTKLRSEISESKTSPLPPALFQAQIRASMKATQSALSNDSIRANPLTTLQSILNAHEAANFSSLSSPPAAALPSRSGIPSISEGDSGKAARGFRAKQNDLATTPLDNPNSYVNIRKALVKVPEIGSVGRNADRYLVAAMIAGYTADQAVVLAKSLGADLPAPTTTPPEPTNRQKVRLHQIYSAYAIDYLMNSINASNMQTVMKSVIYGATKGQMERIITGLDSGATKEQIVTRKEIMKDIKRKMSRVLTSDIMTFQKAALQEGINALKVDGTNPADIIAGIIAGYSNVEISRLGGKSPAVVTFSSAVDSTSQKEEPVEESPKVETVTEQRVVTEKKVDKRKGNVKTEGSLTSISGMFNLIYNIPTGS
ncbi:MAG: hypothetical protein LBS66_00460, partial [Rhodospirillaceae bacterium]|nr:hypothetical protein [Rhodospirillaceae bacterium]